MDFFQQAPTLGNQYTDDRVLRGYLARVLPREIHAAIEPSLHALGRLSGGELYALQRADLHQEPRLVSWDPWGHRVDTIEVTPLWQRAGTLAAEEGVVAAAYEPAHGVYARVHQFAVVHLFNPSTDVYTCPLAMTDGAARTLIAHKNIPLIEHAVPRLTSRDPAKAWTSGQWMTERTGGSDVGLSEAVARCEDGQWRLYGTKWFTSATTAQMALTLARPTDNPPGGKGLALFYVETRDDHGRLRNIQINRLKDKLGTRKVPTAEITLVGTPAVLVAGKTGGVRAITPMLTITRTWNAVSAVSGMRRCIALAQDYARHRVAFGARLQDKPLHTDTLAGVQAEYEAGFHLAFFAAELLGRDERSTLDAHAAELLRLVTPLAKLTTGKQAVAVASEVLEAFGGAGYVEDTGLPMLLRDAQVLPIWEGTTNVLALDVLRALARGEGLAVLISEVEALTATALGDSSLGRPASAAREAIAHARRWFAEAVSHDLATLEAGARRFALTLGRSLALALLVRHAQWSFTHSHDGRPAAAARRFARNGVDLIDDDPFLADSAALANDTPLG